MMQQDHELHASIRSLIQSYFSRLRRPVRKNLARLTCAFLHLAWSIRFGYGGLHLTSIARVLPEGKKFKSSYKLCRLDLFTRIPGVCVRHWCE